MTAHISVDACVLVHGVPGYFEAAAQTVRSVLEHTGFALFIAKGAGGTRHVPLSRRFHVVDIPDVAATTHRSWRFLKKFEALTHWLRGGAGTHVLLLDADTVIVAPLTAEDVRAALGDRGL